MEEEAEGQKKRRQKHEGNEEGVQKKELSIHTSNNLSVSFQIPKLLAEWRRGAKAAMPAASRGPSSGPRPNIYTKI